MLSANNAHTVCMVNTYHGEAAFTLDPLLRTDGPSFLTILNKLQFRLKILIRTILFRDAV